MYVLFSFSCDELESSSPNVSFEPSVSPGNSNHGACSGNHGACSGNHGACSGNHGACSGNHGDCSGNHGDSSYCLDDDSLGDSVGSSAGRCQMMKVVKALIENCFRSDFESFPSPICRYTMLIHTLFCRIPFFMELP